MFRLSILNIIHKQYSTLNENGITVVNTLPFYTELRDFLSNYTKYVRRTNSLKTEQYSSLPFVYGTDIENELSFRRKSYALVKNHIRDKKNLRILEIGPWNSWLTPLLCKNNNRVVAIDYFIDEVNGLETRKHHLDPQWISIQCDLENPEFFNCEFDLIVFNHNIQFFTNPLETIKQYSGLLCKNGQILLLGTSIFKNHRPKEKQVDALKKHYQTKHGVDLFFRPSKGYLNLKDKITLQKQGFVFQPYPVSFIKSLILLFLPHKPQYYFACFEKPPNTL